AEEGRQVRGVSGISLESVPLAGGVMTWDGPGSWLNRATGMGLEGPVPDAAVDRIVAYYRERDATPHVEVCSYAHPSLLDALAKRGFVVREIDHALGRGLDAGARFAELLPGGWPRGLEIVRVNPDDEAQLETFVAASTVGFRPAGEPIAP